MNLPAITSENPLLKPNVIEEHKADVFNIVKGSIAQCYAHLNAIVPADLSYLVNAVTDSIIEKYPTLRIAEIPQAFAKGIRNNYGEYYGLCVVSFEKFITGYLESDERAKLVKEKNKIIDFMPEPTPDEKFTTGKQLSIDLFEKFKKSGQFDRTILSVYEFCKYYDLIDKDYRKGIYQESEELYIKNKEIESALTMDLIKRRRLNKELKLLKNNIENNILTKDQYSDILRCGQHIALKNWFNDLIIEEINFYELIETKR
jgi:hypothetical protein